ncbi:unnamed protein product [Protopolystoma xenopodis]|uniref:Uncharacterized protein n=1 Tax=Protopolystoma xenopodis TaxID=117903 RepID=A0A3S5AXW5_9PLAT|nr:unnamed protein product [Protopolystoma xenopodis]
MRGPVVLPCLIFKFTILLLLILAPLIGAAQTWNTDIPCRKTMVRDKFDNLGFSDNQGISIGCWPHPPLVNIKKNSDDVDSVDDVDDVDGVDGVLFHHTLAALDTCCPVTGLEGTAANVESKSLEVGVAGARMMSEQTGAYHIGRTKCTRHYLNEDEARQNLGQENVMIGFTELFHGQYKYSVISGSSHTSTNESEFISMVYSPGGCP